MVRGQEKVDIRRPWAKRGKGGSEQWAEVRVGSESSGMPKDRLSVDPPPPQSEKPPLHSSSHFEALMADIAQVGRRRPCLSPSWEVALLVFILYTFLYTVAVTEGSSSSLWTSFEGSSLVAMRYFIVPTAPQYDMLQMLHASHGEMLHRRSFCCLVAASHRQWKGYAMRDLPYSTVHYVPCHALAMRYDHLWRLLFFPEIRVLLLGLHLTKLLSHSKLHSTTTLDAMSL